MTTKHNDPKARYESASGDLHCNKLTVNVEGVAAKRYVSPRNPGSNELANHLWERAGLGVAPYKLIGSGEMTYQAHPDAPVQPGGSCDYCGQGIRNVFFIRAACGSTFKVGCDCVKKVCDKREGVRKEVDAAVRDAQKVARAARHQKKGDELAEIVATNRERFATIPHPRRGTNKFFETKTYADYVDFMLANCGAKGRATLIKEVRLKVRELAGESPPKCDECGMTCKRVGGAKMCADDMAAADFERRAHG